MTSAAPLPRARFTASFPCPVCTGHEHMRRGENKRCHGYLLELEPGRQIAYCARVPSYLPSPSGQLWGHWLDGDEHGRCAVPLPAPTSEPIKKRRWRSALDPLIFCIHDYGSFEVVRFHQGSEHLPKCMPRHCDAMGRLWFGLPRDVRCSGTPLYREAEAVAALRAGTPLYVVEGESDVDAVTKAGTVATCNPFGAEKFQLRHARTIADVTSSAPIRVVRDMDEPGLRHVRQVRTRLLGAGVEAARIQMLQPAVGNDVRDHLSRGETLATLRRMDGEL